VRLSVVVPAYGGADHIARTVARIDAALAAVEHEVVVVDDGSPDDLADRAAAAGARVVRLEHNRGKGAAVRAGVQVATGDVVAFTDADLAYAPAQLLALLEAIEGGSDVAVGSRWHPGSTRGSAAPVLRRVSSRLFNVLTAVIVGQYRDTQCGLKAFRADAARRLFAQARIDGFAFDVELLHLATRFQLTLVDVPVTLDESGGSTVQVGRSALAMVRDLWRVRRWSRSGAYD
jgi:dolichyl-phosphate beta-glucosyltransferase